MTHTMKHLLFTALLLFSTATYAGYNQLADSDAHEPVVGDSMDEPYTKVEKMPMYPGGKDALIEFLKNNMKYPEAARKKGIEGRVICQFIVDRDGTITDVTVVRSGGHPSLDKEAVRVIKAMPKWIPGEKDGQKVRVKYTVPLNFRL